MIKRCGMELDELHILYETFGTVDHGNTVSGSNQRIGGVAVNSTYTSRSHQRHFGKESIHFARVFIQHIRSVALDARCGG